MSTIAEAYSATAPEWQAGPGRIYDRLSKVLVAASPVSLAQRRVLDVGAGTGAAGRAASAAGAAEVVAVDAAAGMVAALCAASIPAGVVGDATALPFADGAFDAAIAAFSLNHVDDPISGLREMARVTRPGSPLLASSYATDDTHPVKSAVEAALAQRGWRPESWYLRMRVETVPRLATVERCSEVAAAAGLSARVEGIRVAFPELSARELVEWRLGMAQHAAFVARLGPGSREELVADALGRLGGAPVLERSVIVISAVND